MKKKLILTLGTIAATTLPIVTVVSCGTSWVRWNKSNSKERQVAEFPPSKKAPLKEWSTRIDDDEVKKAWDEVNSTIDLDMLNNQYELLDLISIILGLKSSTFVGNYWNDFKGMETYLQGIKTKQTIKFKYNNETGDPVNIDLTNVLSDMIGGLTDPNAQSGYVPDELKDKGGITTYAEENDFLSNDYVNILVGDDVKYALTLQKMVYLPKNTFNGFKDLLEKLNDFLSDIFNQNENPELDDWLNTNNQKVNANGYPLEFTDKNDITDDQMTDIVKYWKVQFLKIALGKTDN